MHVYSIYTGGWVVFSLGFFVFLHGMRCIIIMFCQPNLLNGFKVMIPQQQKHNYRGIHACTNICNVQKSWFIFWYWIVCSPSPLVPLVVLLSPLTTAVLSWLGLFRLITAPQNIFHWCTNRISLALTQLEWRLGI